MKNPASGGSDTRSTTALPLFGRVVATDSFEVLAIASEAGLVAAAILGGKDRPAIEADVLESSGRAWSSAPPPPEVARVLDAAERWFVAYARDGRAAVPQPPLAPAGSPFRARVWDALRAIPPGESVAYSDLASALGVPKATRAVASAVASNAIALLVPCHRVVPKSGGVGQFRWGAETKRRLLAHEASPRRAEGRTPPALSEAGRSIILRAG